MSKTEYAWVIQRDDGMYVNFMDNDDLTWYEHTWQATMTWSKHQAEKDIVLWKLQNCRPVKVEIRVVGSSMEEKIEYTDTINYVVTTQPDLVAGYIDELNERIAELEKELAELKEKAIVPRFKKGQEVWHFITGEKPMKDTVARNDLFMYELGISKFGIYEDYLCETEQEAQAKLQELRGGE